MTPRARRDALWWLVWFGALAVLTLVFLRLRGSLDRVHVALPFLLIVLGGSATGGRVLGLSLTAVAYLDFHFFFIARYDSLVMENALDVLVLLTFLVTGITAAHMVTRARSEADAARRRASELERLSHLGAESLSAGQADEAVERVLGLIRSTAGAERVEILPPDAPPLDAVPRRTHQIPLMAHGRPVGALVLWFAAEVPITAEQRRFLDALSYYAALALERARLSAIADTAESLRRAAALRESLLADLSHDFRTPLTTIKALASRLDARCIPEAAIIEREADRLHRIASDLLDLSRLQAGALRLRLEVNTAGDLVGAALQRLEGLGGPTRLTVQHVSTVDEDALIGRFDFVQSLRALANLLENALKYSTMPVELAVDCDGSLLRFRVLDRGPGVPYGEEDLIFEPFHRAPSTHAGILGAGLGLPIARRLAREQGGDVLYSRRPGGGSQFELLLPAIPMSEAASWRALAIEDDPLKNH